MIGPKVDGPSARDEREAYELATIRDRATCVRCRAQGNVQRDHRRNRSQGGRTVVENLQCLCPSCHLWKTEHPKQATVEGWACPGWADPATFPAARMFTNDNGAKILGWCVYLPSGRVEEISVEEALRRMKGGA